MNSNHKHKCLPFEYWKFLQISISMILLANKLGSSLHEMEELFALFKNVKGFFKLCKKPWKLFSLNHLNDFILIVFF